MENIPSPEPRPSLISRITTLVAEKRSEVAEKYGKTDWRTSKELMDTQMAFMGGVTLAVGLAVLGQVPGIAESVISYLPKVVGTSVGVAAIGAELWTGFKLLAIEERRRLQKAK
jgi:hypothetical protein